HDILSFPTRRSSDLGKSHFLKILSYLLEDREVGGKRAIQYFLDEDKIKDPMVVADMKLACSVPTDAILFNIDSKSESSGQKGKEDRKSTRLNSSHVK